MNIEIKRYQSDEGGAFSTIEYNGKVRRTVEKPWKNNEQFVSCVPAGTYTLVPFNSPKHGSVLCLFNKEMGITVYEEPGCIRYSCLIHVANFPRDVVGCIGIGMQHIGGMVTSSRKAISEFYHDVSPHEEHTLVIKWGEKP